MSHSDLLERWQELHRKLSGNGGRYVPPSIFLIPVTLAAQPPLQGIGGYRMSNLKARELNIFVEKGIESRPRYLRYDFNALADFEQINGMGLGQLLTMKAVFGTARAMLWAGCKGDDPSLTLNRAGDLVGQYVQAGGSIDEVLGKCFEAATDQGAIGSPEPEEEGENDESGNASPPTQKKLKEASKRGASGSKKPNP